MYQSRNFLEFPVDEFSKIQQQLQERFKGFVDTVQNKTEIIEWSFANIGDLYTVVEQEFKSRDARVIRARLFNTAPNKFLDCHIDGVALDDRYWALNIPIFVPAERHTHSWYNYSGKLTKLANSTYTDYFVPEDKTKLTLIDELVLDKPNFVKVGTIHRVENFTPSPRLIMTIRYQCQDAGKFLTSFTNN
jgi:hypothetical protein